MSLPLRGSICGCAGSPPVSNPTVLFNVLGLLAGSLTTLSFMPQMLRIWRRRSADDLSYGALALFITGISLWVLYGAALHSFPIMITNAVTLALNLSILALKILHDRARARRHSSE